MPDMFCTIEHSADVVLVLTDKEFNQLGDLWLRTHAFAAQELSPDIKTISLGDLEPSTKVLIIRVSSDGVHWTIGLRITS